MIQSIRVENHKKHAKLPLYKVIKWFYVYPANRNLTKLHSLVTLCNCYPDRTTLRDKKVSIRIDDVRVWKV